MILGVDGVAAEKLSVADVASMLTGAQFACFTCTQLTCFTSTYASTEVHILRDSGG